MAALRQLMISDEHPTSTTSELKEENIDKLEEYMHTLEVSNPSKPFRMTSGVFLPIGSVVF